MKLSRCIKELERIYGVEYGGDRKSRPNVSDLKSQSDIAEMIGISVDTLQNYKKLTELVPELQDWVETGVLAPTTAIALIKYMSPSEQEDFISSMDITQRITKREVQQYIDRIKQLEILICFNFTFIVMWFFVGMRKRVVGIFLSLTNKHMFYIATSIIERMFADVVLIFSCEVNSHLDI